MLGENDGEGPATWRDAGLELDLKQLVGYITGTDLPAETKAQKECRCFYPHAAKMSAPHLPPISGLDLGREHDASITPNFPSGSNHEIVGD